MKKAIVIAAVLALILAFSAAALSVPKTCPRGNVCVKACRDNAVCAQPSQCPMYADENGDGICDSRGQNAGCPMQTAGHHGKMQHHGWQNAMPCRQ